MSFFKQKNKSPYTLLVSLKSSSIDLQLVLNEYEKLKEVLLTDRHTIFLENSQNSELYTKQYTKELSSIFQKNQIKINQLTENKEYDIHFILYSPWFSSSITTIEQLEPIVINDVFLEKTLSTVTTDKKLHILEKRILKIESNGYVLTDFPKNKTSNIHLQVYTSYISDYIYKLLSSTIQTYFPTKIIHTSYTTNPLMLLDSIKRFMIKEDNVTFLYVDNEITQVGVIEDDSLIHFVTFPIGKHDFLREIQKSVKTYDYEALYQREIQIKSKEQLEQFETLKKKWVLSILQSLELLKKQIPNKLIIISDTKTKDFFTDILLDYIKNTPDNLLKNNRIINFDISLLKDIIISNTSTWGNELDLKLEALI